MTCKTCVSQNRIIAGVSVLVLATLWLLVGCQGVSSGSSSATPGNTGTTGSGSVGQLTITPSTLDLGSVVVGASGNTSGSLKATGASVIVTGATTNNTAFSIGGLALPVTIPAGQSASFSVTFSPLISGTANGTLTISSDAQPSTTTLALSGSGTAAPTHTVSLSWNASTSSGVSGYNVYRALYANSACGSFSKINTVLDTGTLYSDNSVTDGKAYCYASTAVNTSNQESGYSNVASNVQIPAP